MPDERALQFVPHALSLQEKEVTPPSMSDSGGKEVGSRSLITDTAGAPEGHHGEGERLRRVLSFARVIFLSVLASSFAFTGCSRRCC
jgi:hypothetical protein